MGAINAPWPPFSTANSKGGVRAIKNHGVSGHDRGSDPRGHDQQGQERGHDGKIDQVAFLAQGRALTHAEAVLLVDDGESQARELDAALEEGMRADEDVHFTGLNGF